MPGLRLSVIGIPQGDISPIGHVRAAHVQDKSVVQGGVQHDGIALLFSNPFLGTRAIWVVLVNILPTSRIAARNVKRLSGPSIDKRYVAKLVNACTPRLRIRTIRAPNLSVSAIRGRSTTNFKHNPRVRAL